MKLALSRQSYPIEVGATNGTEHYTALIRPMGHWTDWSHDSESVHKLSRGRLQEYGLCAEIVAHELNALFGQSTIYCDAIAWDSFWARVLYSDNCIQQCFEISDINELLCNNDTAILSYLRAKEALLNSGKFTAHRALDDAKIIWNSLPVCCRE